jgi:2',3'-cyclic-nucleotide 2'-phosphodiesterase (5'-nucleotidase family)
MPRIALAITLSLLTAVSAGLSGCGRRAPTAEPSVATGPPRLLIMSSLIGYVEPCGCTLDLLLGGIDRVATRVAEERAKGPTAVLLVGSTFFEGPAPTHLLGQEQAKADLLARALKQIGVQAFVPGAGDLTHGAQRFAALAKAANLPNVTLNQPQGQGALLTLGTVKVGVFGLRDPGNDDLEALLATTTQEAARLRAAGAQVVLVLGSVPRRTLRRLARKTDTVDLWVLGDHPSDEEAASPAGSGYLIEAGDRGRGLGRVLLFGADGPGPLRDPVGDDARLDKTLASQLKMKQRMGLMMKTPALTASIAKLKAQIAAQAAAPPPDLTGKRFEYRLLPVEKADTPDPTIEAWLKAYNDGLKAINLAAAGTVVPVKPGGKHYSGDVECSDCHVEAVDVYAPTAHARAWQTLVDAGKTFDAGCVGCHVVGWQQPGGTVLGQTKGLENVQCEACHGPGGRHNETTSEADIKRRVPKAVCETCHNSHHSPKFDYDTYLPKILGPGHGRPAE